MKMSLSVALAFAIYFILTVSAQAIPEGPGYPSLDWTEREESNFLKVSEAPLEQAASPAFLERWAVQALANEQQWLGRALTDLSWLDPSSGNSQTTPACAAWTGICVGDPFRYPAADGLDGEPFYRDEAEVVPVVFYDRDCSRLSGRVWAPRGSGPGDGLPAVVIENGSIQAPETAYWWAAQALVRAGYVVMTFDPRSQGSSDFLSPDGEIGSNLDPPVFAENLVDAIDFFRSSAARPYPHQLGCAGTYPTVTAAYNPFASRIDPARLGIAGHSLGANSVTRVQAYGAPGEEPWPGLLDDVNPVKAAVTWDPSTNPQIGSGGTSNYVPVDEVVLAVIAFPPVLTPRVPLMNQHSEYGFFTSPFTKPEDPESHKAAYRAWSDARVPVFQFTIQGSSHFEWSLMPSLQATSWCPDPWDDRCAGGWGNPMAAYYSVAWFDRWLKAPGEPGYCDADRRLLADADWRGRYSFYFRSARDFADRGGEHHVCEDIRAGCADTASEPSPLCRGRGSGNPIGGTPVGLLPGQTEADSDVGMETAGPGPAASGGCALTPGEGFPDRLACFLFLGLGFLLRKYRKEINRGA